MHGRRVTMGTWRILSVRGGGHEDTQYQLASGIAARAHLRVRGGHRGVHALRHPHANPEHGGLARRGGAHLRARDGRRVGVQGQLPAHHQQHNDGRLRVQGGCTAPSSARASAPSSRRATTTPSATRTSSRAGLRTSPMPSKPRRWPCSTSKRTLRSSSAL